MKPEDVSQESWDDAIEAVRNNFGEETPYAVVFYKLHRTFAYAIQAAKLEAYQEAAKVADEWMPLDRLLPLASDEMNEAAHTGHYEAGERIADAIRALGEEK